MIEHLYIHVPFCDGKCHYCGFYSIMAQPGFVQIYSQLPAKEVAWQLRTLAEVGSVKPRTIYFGGGTPSLLGSDGIKRLSEQLAQHVAFDALEEWTVELNPASTTAPFLQTLRQIGVNRISIGVQIFDDAALARVGRRHSAERAVDAVKLAQDVGFENTGIDLIASLPEVSREVWEETLERTTTLDLKHISVYALILEPETALALQVAQGLELPGDDEQLVALAEAEAQLGAHGFERYEISNYAQPGYECRHNVAVWRGEDYLGLGPSAASRVGRRRWTNEAELQGYMEALGKGEAPPRREELLNGYDNAVERTLFALRMAEGIDPECCFERYPVLREHAQRWRQRLEQLAQLGIVKPSGGRWRLTARGREVCDAVLRELI